MNWNSSNARQNFHFKTSHFNKSLIRILWAVWRFSPHQVPVVFVLSAVVSFHPVVSSPLLLVVRVSTSRRRSRAGQVAACVSTTAKCARTLIGRKKKGDVEEDFGQDKSTKPTRERQSFVISTSLKDFSQSHLSLESKELPRNVYLTHLLGLGHFCNSCSPLLFKLIILLIALSDSLCLQGFPLVQLSAVDVVLSATFLKKAKQRSLTLWTIWHLSVSCILQSKRTTPSFTPRSKYKPLCQTSPAHFSHL